MLEWTGERFLPWLDNPALAYEHLHRYFYATKFVSGKVVLDLASGEGYGANILAQTAERVIGIDIAQDAIDHSRKRYARSNLRFIAGSVTKVPIAESHVFDVVVCFEAIEHIEDHQGLMSEVVRLLKPSGVLLISTPNKSLYGETNHEENRFHVKELGLEQYCDLLREHFGNVRLFGQRISVQSNIWPISAPDRVPTEEFLVERGASEFTLLPGEKRAAVYYLAIASHEPAGEEVGGSALIDESNALLAEKDRGLEKYRLSLSWRITAPLRWASDRVKDPRLFFAREKSEGAGTREPSSALKEACLDQSRIRLRAFLNSGEKLNLPTQSAPSVSIIIVLFNRAELTLECFRSIRENYTDDMEVIVVDNASSDETPRLLERVNGPRVIRNGSNRNFLLSVNQAVREARGQYVLLLNNDAQILPGSLKAALETIRTEPDVGAVGGRIVRLDGRLQEAGSIVWVDGSCAGYGRGGDPQSSEYMFRRDVDYCSAVFLLTPRIVWERLGGFDEAFAPAYYEDTDYCMRLWAQGLRVIYEPQSVILHYEFASSSSTKAASRLQAAHRRIFAERHAGALTHRARAGKEALLVARFHGLPQRRLLFIDDQPPRRWLGSGFPRARSMHLALRKLGFRITIFSTSASEQDWSDVYSDLPRDIEVMNDARPALEILRGLPVLALLEAFLRTRRGYYEAIVISRPQNMVHFKAVLAAHPDWFEQTAVIYDAEALVSLRDVGLRRLCGDALTDQDASSAHRGEVELALGADCVVAVSEMESAIFRSHNAGRVYVLGHAIELPPPSPPFEGRSGFLFVGAIHDDVSPNGDSMVWFLAEVWDRIRNRIGGAMLTIAGINNSAHVRKLAGPSVCIAGPLANLGEFYDRARVFIAPTRFAAGIPHKVHEAAAHGLPVVATPILARQLQWNDGIEIGVADGAAAFAEKCIELHEDRQLWERIRTAALDAVRLECSSEVFEKQLENIVTTEVRLKRGF